MGDGSIHRLQEGKSQPLTPAPGRGDSIKHCTWTQRWKEAEERNGNMGGGQAPSHSTPHRPVTTTLPWGSHHLRRKCVCGVFKNMNITVCHSCSHARGAPGNPRQTPRVGAGHAPPAWPLPPLQTLSCKTHNRGVSERSQEPSKLWSSAGSLPPALGRGGCAPSSSQGAHAITRHDLGHCSSGSASSSSNDTTPEAATSEAFRCGSQLPTGGEQSGWQSLQGARSSSAVGRQDSMRGEL